MKLPPYYRRLAETIEAEIASGSLEVPEHCKHGRYIGNWAGPDYLCGWCEAGDSNEDVALEEADRAWRVNRHAIGREIKDLLVKTAGDTPRAVDTLAADEYMALMSVAMFLCGDLRHEIKTVDQALAALAMNRGA